MAVAVARGRKEVRTGLHMNFLFFLMSMSVLVVMVISMWKDTNPQWLSYQEKFIALERHVLVERRDKLMSEINSPNYVRDYDAAKKTYDDAKAKNDAASNDLEQTEADLEELEVQAQMESDLAGAAQAVQPGPSASAMPSAAGSKATQSDLDELDKAFAGTGGAKAAPSKPAQTTKPSDKDLAELDKEFSDNTKGKAAANEGHAKQPSTSPQASKQSSDDMAELDKEFANKPNPGGSSKNGSPEKQAKSASKSETADMAELDKEFKDAGKPKSTPAQGSVATQPAAATASTAFPEADLQVDPAGARARFEAAQRDLLIATRTHGREMLGLPESATLKRRLSDERLKEKSQSLALAQTGVVLEDATEAVKNAAQIARWAANAKTLQDLTAKHQLDTQPADHLKQLTAAKASLDAHMEDLRRDLRLVEGQLSRNLASAPEIEQTYVDRLGAIDRCETCHKAVEEAGFENAAEPFRTHSPELLRNHPIERFGCVSCHGGWGSAVDKTEAHGGIVGKGRPLLIGDQVQSSCGKCHGETRQLSGEATYLAGASLFQNSGCLGCHKVDINQLADAAGPSARVVEKPAPKAGPDLDRVAEKIQPAWLVGWLQNPQSHSLDARMPNLGLKKDEAMSIATYLLTQRGNVHASNSGESSIPTAQRLALGRKLTVNLGCLGCHTVRGEGASVGPELTNIRTKVNAEWLYGWIANPKSYFPNSRMPVFNLTRDQCVLIGDYLLSVGSGARAPNDAMPNLTDNVARDNGAALISERGCAGCHDIRGFDRISAPDLTHEGDKGADVLEFGNAKKVKRDLYDYILNKIMDPRSFDSDKFHGKMPKFGLHEDDAKTIAIYLMSLTARELPPSTHETWWSKAHRFWPVVASSTSTTARRATG